MTDGLAMRPIHRPIAGRVRVPGSKSITNRALILAALADGESVIANALSSDDTRYMAESLRRLGVGVREDGDTIAVRGSGGPFPAGEASLYVGNSGTSMRFLTAAVALGRGSFTLDGSQRMRERPLAPLIDALRQLGVAISGTANGTPPVAVSTQGIDGGSVTVRGDLSSQYFSALMMAGPLTRDGLTIAIAEGTELVSVPYIRLTASVMAAFDGEAQWLPDERRIVVPGGRSYRGGSFEVEPDASAASYFFAAAAATGGTVTVEGLGERSVQGDLRFVDVLRTMGASVRSDRNATTVTGPSELKGGDFDFRDISDTFMTLAAIAPLADSPVTIRSIGFTRGKETDRVRAVATELRRLGVRVDEEWDSLTIYPGIANGAAIETYDDHRIAMSFAILGLVVPGITILNPGCVAKTFPAFFDTLWTLVGE